MLASVIDLLGCPQCPADDAGAEGTVVRRVSSILGRDANHLRCLHGHSFDIAKQGYVNLLPGRAGANADTVAMISARETFLASGHYQPIVTELGRVLGQPRLDPAGRPRPAHTVLEAGAGTGFYLAGSLPEHGRGLACDISTAAARKAAKQHHIGAVVADTWAGLPVLDDVIDAVLCIFAPRNFAEFARVLRPGGVLVTVTPTSQHLAGLREELGLMAVEADKQQRLHREAAEHFSLRGEKTVGWQFEATPEQVRALVEMGPNAFHGSPAAVIDRPVLAGAEVTLSVFEPLSHKH